MPEPRIDFELKPDLHESLIGHFEVMTENNFTRIAKNAGMEGFNVTFNETTGVPETVELNGEIVRVEELKKNGRFYDELRRRMSPEQRARFDAQVREAAGKKVYRTGAEIEKSRKVSEKSGEKAKEVFPELDVKDSQGRKKFNETLAELAGKASKYAFLAGMTALGLYELGEANKGCYLINQETSEYVTDKLSGSTDKTQCTCSSFANACNTYCGKQDNPAQMVIPGTTQIVFYNPDSCATDCACMRKGKSGQEPQFQPQSNNAEFKVVEGGVWNTFSRLLGSVGYEVKRFVNDAMDIVDSVAKGISDLFSKWWVILIIVGVGLVIILVPTLVTQLPKAKQKSITGGAGRFKHYPLAYYPYY